METGLRPLETGLGINQELSGDYDPLPSCEPGSNLRLAAAFGAGLHIQCSELAFGFREHDDVPGAGLDDRFTWYQ